MYLKPMEYFEFENEQLEGIKEGTYFNRRCLYLYAKDGRYPISSSLLKEVVFCSVEKIIQLAILGHFIEEVLE